MRFCPTLDRDVTSGEMDMQSCFLACESPSAFLGSDKDANSSKQLWEGHFRHFGVYHWRIHLLRHEAAVSVGVPGTSLQWEGVEGRVDA